MYHYVNYFEKLENVGSKEGDENLGALSNQHQTTLLEALTIDGCMRDPSTGNTNSMTPNLILFVDLVKKI